jgi:hypothetical protein
VNTWIWWRNDIQQVHAGYVIYRWYHREHRGIAFCYLVSVSSSSFSISAPLSGSLAIQISINGFLGCHHCMLHVAGGRGTAAASVQVNAIAGTTGSSYDGRRAPVAVMRIARFDSSKRRIKCWALKFHRIVNNYANICRGEGNVPDVPTYLMRCAFR